jgi:hypothetical protein
MNHRQLAVLSSERGAVPAEYVREIISPVRKWLNWERLSGRGLLFSSSCLGFKTCTEAKLAGK